MRRSCDFTPGWLAQNCVGDLMPLRRVRKDYVHDEALANDQCRERIEIDQMNATDHDEIAHDAEKDQEIHANVERVQQCRESSEGRSRKRTGRDQHEAAMEFRLLPPKDCQRKRDGEASDIPKRDGKKLPGIGLMEGEHFEARHADCGRDAEYKNCNAPCDAEPSQRAMDPHLVHPYERRLHDEKDDPA